MEKNEFVYWMSGISAMSMTVLYTLICMSAGTIGPSNGIIGVFLLIITMPISMLLWIGHTFACYELIDEEWRKPGWVKGHNPDIYSTTGWQRLVEEHNPECEVG